MNTRNTLLLALALNLAAGCAPHHGSKPDGGIPARASGLPTKPESAAQATSQTSQAKLTAAREALRGTPKDTARAKTLLLEIVGHEKDTLEPTDLCHAYVYLGYIEDLAGNRAQAIPWYQKALGVQEANKWIRECASYGLERPLTWIRHLDEATTPLGASNPPARIFDLGKAYVTNEQPPKGLVPARSLSPQERQENFDLLWEAIDKTHADFELKGIDWPEVRRRYQAQLAQVETADAFYVLLFNMVNELKDTHSWLQNYTTPRPEHGPGLAVDLFGGKPFVVTVKPDSQAAALGVKPGAEVVEIDGATVEENLARLRPYLPGRSSERAYQRDACHYLLAGKKGSTKSW